MDLVDIMGMIMDSILRFILCVTVSQIDHKGESFQTSYSFLALLVTLVWFSVLDLIGARSPGTWQHRDECSLFLKHWSTNRQRFQTEMCFWMFLGCALLNSCDFWKLLFKYWL